MLPRAYIVHQIRSRLRLRIPEKCQDADYFASLENQLTAVPLLTEVEVSPVSGSVLLLHPFHASDVVKMELERLGLFELVDAKPPAVSPMQAVTARMARTDSLINEVSAGGLDFRTLAFLVAMVITLQQAVRGNFAGPAIPMFLTALSLIPSGGGDTPVAEPE
ncbi:MAG: hypothetical protein R3179_01835 [Sedimenticolaceae bacterium]|nr:hypothetical protein [Sedimenticolaceae bacterium]